MSARTLKHKIFLFDICQLGLYSRVRLFKATVESVLVYGCETWTMSKALNCVIDGFYTRLLRKVFRISWKYHTTKYLELYGDIPKISTIIRERKLWATLTVLWDVARYSGFFFSKIRNGIYRHEPGIS